MEFHMDFRYWPAECLWWLAMSVTSLAFGDYLFVLMAPLFLGGVLLNALAWHRNGERMPVRVLEHQKVEFFVKESELHCVMTETSRVPYLCDIIRVGNRVLSLGDIALGAAFLLSWIYGIILITGLLPR